MTKNKQLILMITLVSMAGITAMRPEKSSSGAPPSHTGAPGDATCATSGCHDDNALNSGTASITFETGEDGHYTPGRTYTAKVTINDPGYQRFGFQVVALSSDNGNSMGKMLVTDTYRTQITKNQYQLQGREYITYTYDGTDAVSPGKGEWTFNWQAPATLQGPVTFYLSTVTGDDDESDKGDFVFTRNFTLQPVKLNGSSSIH